VGKGVVSFICSELKKKRKTLMVQSEFESRIQVYAARPGKEEKHS
jgi:hypothetical protein